MDRVFENDCQQFEIEKAEMDRFDPIDNDMYTCEACGNDVSECTC